MSNDRPVLEVEMVEGIWDFCPPRAKRAGAYNQLPFPKNPSLFTKTKDLLVNLFHTGSRSIRRALRFNNLFMVFHIVSSAIYYMALAAAAGIAIGLVLALASAPPAVAAVGIFVSSMAIGYKVTTQIFDLLDPVI